jgi:hypothetical protein
VRPVVIQRYGHGSRVAHRFRGDLSSRIVVLLEVDRIHGPDDEAQTAALLELLRDEREMVKVITLRLACRNQLRLAEALPIAGSQELRSERDTAAVRADLVEVSFEVGIVLID